MMPVASPRSLNSPIPSPKGSRPNVCACPSSWLLGFFASLAIAKSTASFSFAGSNFACSGVRRAYVPAGGTYVD